MALLNLEVWLSLVIAFLAGAVVVSGLTFGRHG